VARESLAGALAREPESIASARNRREVGHA
jgi:hypothetical protein